MGNTCVLHQLVRRDDAFLLRMFTVLLACPSPPQTSTSPAQHRKQGRSVLPKRLSTLFLFLLLLLLQLPLLYTAEVGLPNATGLADGLQETGTPSRGVHHFLRGSLD